MTIKKRPTKTKAKSTTKTKAKKSIFGNRREGSDGTGQYANFFCLVDSFERETDRTLDFIPRNEDVTLRMQAILSTRKSIAENAARLTLEEYEHHLAEERAGEEMIRVMALLEVLSEAENARQSYMYRVRLRQEVSDEERAWMEKNTAARLFEAYGDDIPDEVHDRNFAGLRPPRNPAFLNTENPHISEIEIASRAKREARRSAKREG